MYAAFTLIKQKRGQYGALEYSPTYMCGKAENDAKVVKY